jgi:hypothetical protein
MNWGALFAAGERKEGFVIFWQQQDLTKRGIGVESRALVLVGKGRTSQNKNIECKIQN